MFQNDPAYQHASRVPALSAGSLLRQMLVSESQGSDFGMSHELTWSDDSTAIFANTRQGIVVISATLGSAGTLSLFLVFWL